MYEAFMRFAPFFVILITVGLGGLLRHVCRKELEELEQKRAMKSYSNPEEQKQASNG